MPFSESIFLLTLFTEICIFILIYLGKPIPKFSLYINFLKGIIRFHVGAHKDKNNADTDKTAEPANSGSTVESATPAATPDTVITKLMPVITKDMLSDKVDESVHHRAAVETFPPKKPAKPDNKAEKSTGLAA